MAFKRVIIRRVGPLSWLLAPTMHISEIVYKRLEGLIQPNDYIQWAIASVESGVKNDKVWELASLNLHSWNDEKTIENLFLSCAEDLHLKLTIDGVTAIVHYADHTAQQIASGQISIELGREKFSELCEWYDFPLLSIWSDLEHDLFVLQENSSDFVPVNSELNSQPADIVIRNIATQFSLLSNMQLPEGFPHIAFCNTCGFVRLPCCSAETKPEIAACNCANGDSHLDMRRYNDREILLSRRVLTTQSR